MATRRVQEGRACRRGRTREPGRAWGRGGRAGGSRGGVLHTQREALHKSHRYISDEEQQTASLYSPPSTTTIHPRNNFLHTIGREAFYLVSCGRMVRAREEWWAGRGAAACLRHSRQSTRLIHLHLSFPTYLSVIQTSSTPSYLAAHPPSSFSSHLYLSVIHTTSFSSHLYLSVIHTSSFSSHLPVCQPHFILLFPPIPVCHPHFILLIPPTCLSSTLHPSLPTYLSIIHTFPSCSSSTFILLFPPTCPVIHTSSFSSHLYLSIIHTSSFSSHLPVCHPHFILLFPPTCLVIHTRQHHPLTQSFTKMFT
ncbi:hypothetical protein Pcinc_009753 [Petrolisthes cinctipes]|uniref:Uncharacterized protein n=1 Tax=Petrolisthes cinctipes TaxID=88211 RepID=A0AAE1G6T1_PETCI|nr:hypothetical protein Pcinc_009753 [Petrolisthes cinctipes]